MSSTPSVASSSNSSLAKGGSLPETPPSARSSGIILGTLAGEQICCNCEESCPPCEMTQWSKSKLCCHKCKSNYNRHTERMSNNPKLKEWWRALPPDEKVQWYQRNKRLHAPGVKKQWDDFGFVDATSIQHHKTSETLVDYLDFDGWIIRQSLLGVGREAAIKLWEEAMTDKNQKKRKNGDKILLGVFKGVRDRVGSSEVHEQTWKRQKCVYDNIDTETAKGFAEQATKDAEHWANEHSRLAAQGLAASSEHEEMDEAMVRFAQVPSGPALGIDGEVKRDVVLKMQQDSKLQEAEEQDDFLAEQAGRLRRDSVAKAKGRPRKLKAQVLADMGALIRDRKSQLTDQMEKLKNTMRSIEDEAKTTLGDIPEDVKAVESECNTQIIAAEAAVVDACAKLAAIDIKSLTDQDTSIDTLRRMTADNLKGAFEAQSSVTKSLACLRKAVKKAAKEFAKGKKAAESSGETKEMHGIRLAMSNFMQSCAAGNFAFGLVPSVATALAGQGAFRLQGGAAMLGALSAVPGLSQHEKWVRKQVSVLKSFTMATSELRAGVGRSVTTVLGGYSDLQTCLPQVSLPSDLAVLSAELFAPQQFVQVDQHWSTGMTPYGLSEAPCWCNGSSVRYIRRHAFWSECAVESVCYVRTLGTFL